MRLGILLLLLLLSGWGGLTRIHDRNVAVQQARQAYQRGDFAAAATLYKRAVIELRTTDEAVVLNLGHASMKAGQAAEARAAYGRLLTSRTAAVRSVAGQQLAVLAAAKGDYAQALSLLRTALVANPANTTARYNYEVINDYLTRRQQNPDIPPPATADQSGQPDSPEQASNQPQQQPGQDRAGQLNDPTRPNDPRNTPETKQDASGTQDPNRPSPDAGNTANGFRPGPGEQRNVAQGREPGTTRGLSNDDNGPEARSGLSNRAGTEAAALDEAQIQTQRARLEQMNLSSGQARQLLEALGTAEQQYLQQLPRPRQSKPDPSKPAW